MPVQANVFPSHSKLKTTELSFLINIDSISFKFIQDTFLIRITFIRNTFSTFNGFFLNRTHMFVFFFLTKLCKNVFKTCAKAIEENIPMMKCKILRMLGYSKNERNWKAFPTFFFSFFGKYWHVSSNVVFSSASSSFFFFFFHFLMKLRQDYWLS